MNSDFSLYIKINVNETRLCKKGSEKGSDSNDLYCNVLKLTKRKNA